MRFTSQITETTNNINENSDINAIDFGVNVLKWLEYGESSTFSNFKDEIINNPSSTINDNKYKTYEIECKTLCECVDIDINIEEMMSLKLYTDTTKYQSYLRRAFWTISSKQEKLNFYNWAITLYKTFQRYSIPIVCFDTKSHNRIPAVVYHGLDDIFAVETTLPYYNGIISTTISENTANQFSQNMGLLWTIKGSYSNKFKQMIGIPTDWFSAFKNESEIICFNCYIPIIETRNWGNEDAQVNQLMKQL
eukprot:377080_1